MVAPNKIDSNITGLAIAEEASLKTLPGTPVWRAMEPNSYPDFGADVKTTARDTLNPSRQILRGSSVDLDASGGFNSDLTQDNVFPLFQGYFFADAHEKPDTQPINGTAAVVITGVTTTQYQAASGLAGFPATSLVFGSGFANAGNNGLKALSASAAGALTTTGLTAEASPPAAARVIAVGVRGASADITVTAASSAVTLGSTALDFTTLGLNIGEWAFIGGDATANAFATCPKFYGRILSVAAHAIVLDDTTATAVTDTGTGKLIDIYFGKYIRNELVTTSIKRRSYQIERQLGNDGVGIQAEYLLGSIPNECTFNLPTADKASVDMSFVSMDYSTVTGTVGVKAGTRVASPGQSFYNTSHDIYRSKLAILTPGTINPSTLFAFVTDATISIKNGVTGNKALGTFGNFDATQGDFDISGQINAYFSTVAAQTAVRNNADLGFNVIIAAKNAGIVFDIPLLGVGGGKLKIEKDKSVMVPLNMNAGENANGYTFSLTQFNYLPAGALPT